MGIQMAYIKQKDMVFVVFGDSLFLTEENHNPNEIVKKTLKSPAFAKYYSLDDDGIKVLREYISSYRKDERNVQGWMRNARIENELDKMTWNEFDSVFIDNEKINDGEIDAFLSGLSPSPNVEGTAGCSDAPQQPEEVREEETAEKWIPIPEEAVLPFPLPEAVKEAAGIAETAERLKEGGNIQAAEHLMELCHGLENIRRIIDLSFKRLAAYAVSVITAENEKRNDNTATKADCEKLIEGLKKAMEFLPEGRENK